MASGAINHPVMYTTRTIPKETLGSLTANQTKAVLYTFPTPIPGTPISWTLLQNGGWDVLKQIMWANSTSIYIALKSIGVAHTFGAGIDVLVAYIPNT